MSLLSPFGFLYGKVIDLRNSLYDRGNLKAYDLGARTISVGNITTGGTGKTPLVALIAEILAESGEKVCILTRGYGRKNERERVLVSDSKNVLVDAETGGDEPVELALKLLGKATVVADADRVAAAKWAKENFEITTFILDDGFQHRRAKRDLDIVCVDAMNPFGNEKLLPAGSLRERPSSLNRADVIIITRSDLATNLIDIEHQLRPKNGTAAIFKAISQITEFIPLEEFHAEPKRQQRETMTSAYMFCGIGNPQSFVACLRNAGVEVTGVEVFSDHFKYDQAMIRLIENNARSKDVSALVTTGKDAVKLSGLVFTIKCYVTNVETVVENEEEFRKVIISS